MPKRGGVLFFYIHYNCNSIRLFVKVFVLISTILFFAACTNLPSADFYEVDGIVSMSFSPQDGENVSSQRATFYIQHSDNYALWVLRDLPNVDTGDQFLPYRLIDSDGFLVVEGQLELAGDSNLKWVNQHVDQNEKVSVNFFDKGLYTLIIDTSGLPENMVRKVHLTKNNEYPPVGIGYPDTRNPSIDPKFAKRNRSIAIPPAYAFGVMASADSDLHHSWVLDSAIPIDAFWVDNIRERVTALDEVDNAGIVPNSVPQKDVAVGFLIKNLERIVATTELALEKDVDFLLVPPKTTIEKIREYRKLFKESDSRGFLFSDFTNLFEPDLTSYPANRLDLIMSDSVVIDGEEVFAQLRKQTEWISNPRVAAYEAPFVMHDMSFFSQLDLSDAVFDEAYIRWLQFSAFASLMHLYVPEKPLSVTIIAEIEKLTNLRDNLFPYIYSMAHFIRSSKEKPVRGEPAQPGQFMLGDALLVAPVLEQGVEGRAVYFPEGTWYDYWDGTEYDGGQSWFVETPLTKIPVFVKAGSIIPYNRDETGTLAIDIYSGGVSSFRLYEDDGLTDAYLQGEFSTKAFRYFEQEEYATLTIGRRVRGYEGQPDQKKMLLTILYAEEPIEIRANSEPLQQGEKEGEWHYDDSEQAIRINWVQPHNQKTDFEIRF